MNSKISIDDVDRANKIYGYAEFLLIGKMTALSRKQNLRKQIPIPVTLTENQKRLQ